MSTTIPWVSMRVSADVTDGKFSVRRQDKQTGLGDIILMPLMFNYQHSADLNTNYRLAVYAPTGDYEVGRLANTGKNFWTFEPTVGVMYLGQENGIEGSLFLGVDFNTKNSDTDYKSGTQLHIDGTLAQHFPLWGGLADAGITGFWYSRCLQTAAQGQLSAPSRRAQTGLVPFSPTPPRREVRTLLPS